ncbi:MAG: hypothetical protein ABIJ48_09430 [Actinomycetota bacterium]
METAPGISRYPFGPHMLDRQSSPANALRWVIRNVTEEGGQASFVGFGRIARRFFGKISRMLPVEYETTVFIYPEGDPHVNRFRAARHEVVLVVRHRDGPWPPTRVATLGGPRRVPE